MVAVQNQLKQLLLNTQIGMLNNTYKSTNNSGIKNSAVTQLKPAVNQAETLKQETQEQQQTIYGKPEAKTATATKNNDGPSVFKKEDINVDTAGVNTGNTKNKISGSRSDEQFKKDVKIIADLKAEFGNGKKMSHDTHWIDAARKSDKINILDKQGNNIENTQLGGKVGSSDKTIGKGNILEVQSQKYGTVRISVGGDGVMDGGDDTVLSIGGKAAANSISDGLTKQPPKAEKVEQQKEANAALEQKIKDKESALEQKVANQQVVQYDIASCPICKGKGCPQCGVPNGAVPAQQGAAPAQPQQNAISPLLNNVAVDEAKQIIANHKPEEQGVDITKIAEARSLAGSSEVQKVAGNNDEAASIAGKAENAYSLDKDQVNNLIAALMLIANGQFK